MAVQLRLTVWVTDDGVPVTGLSGANIPEITIWNANSGAVVQAAIDGTEIDGGWYGFDFTPTAGLDYVATWDADPQASGQVTTQERFQGLAFSEFFDDVVPEGGSDDYGTLQRRLDVDVSSRATQAEILSDATPFPGANVDAAISSRAAPGDEMDLTDAVLQEIAEDQDTVRTKLYFSDALINTVGRVVPAGAVSHMEVQVRLPAGSFPGNVYFVLFGFDLGDTSSTPPRSSNTQASAPTDGTFTSTEFPT